MYYSEGDAAFFNACPSGSIGTVDQTATVAAASTPTLVRALSSIDALNKRLHALCSSATEIAQMVSGPYPPSGQIAGNNPNAVQPSAMQRLNDAIDEAHTTLSDLDNSLSAIRQSLRG